MIYERLTSATALAMFAAVSALINVAPRVAWLVVGALFIAMLVLMSIDLVAELWTKEIGKLDKPVNYYLMRKFLMILMVVVSAVLDGVVYTVASILPRDFAVLESGFLFITVTTLLWTIALTALCIIQHVESEHGPDVVNPIVRITADNIQRVIRVLRVIDKKRWEQSGHDGAMPSRWKDHLTDNQVARIVQIIEEEADNPAEVPADPTEILEDEQEGPNGTR